MSKGNKSWLMMQLAISVAAGIPFLGKFDVTRGDVLMIDNELHRSTLANRLPKVAAAMGVPMDEIADHIFIESLRGRLRDIHALRPYFNAIEPGRFSLIILDWRSIAYCQRIATKTATRTWLGFTMPSTITMSESEAPFF